VLCLIWAVAALLIGLYLALSLDAIVDSMKDTSNWNTIYDIFGEDSEEFARTVMLAAAFLLIASGALSAISGVLCVLRKMYTVAFVACIVASLMVLLSLVGIVGIIVAVFIHKNKDSFTAGSRTL
jgi:membrane associated rhomboid family serine protease